MAWRKSVKCVLPLYKELNELYRSTGNITAEFNALYPRSILGSEWDMTHLYPQLMLEKNLSPPVRVDGYTPTQDPEDIVHVMSRTWVGGVGGSTDPPSNPSSMPTN